MNDQPIESSDQDALDAQPEPTTEQPPPEAIQPPAVLGEWGMCVAQFSIATNELVKLTRAIDVQELMVTVNILQVQLHAMHLQLAKAHGFDEEGFLADCIPLLNDKTKNMQQTLELAKKQKAQPKLVLPIRPGRG